MRSVFVAMGLITVAVPAEASQPVVAVFNLEGAGSGFKKAELDSVSEYVSTQLAASGRYQVVPRSEVKKALLGQKKASYEACYDESCQIEVGKELAAEKVVVGSIRKFGKVCIVNLRLFDLQKSASAQAGTARGGCADDKVLLSVDGAVAALTGAAMPKAQLTAVTPTPAPAVVPAPAPKVVAPPPVAYTPPAAVPAPAPGVSQAPVKTGDGLQQAGRALANTRRRRSYLRNMAKIERSLCSTQKDKNKVSNVAQMTCSRAPGSRACRRATNRVAKYDKRLQTYNTRRAEMLTKAGTAEGQDFTQALNNLSQRIGACFCDPARGTRRACRYM